MTNDELEGWADVIAVDATGRGLRNGKTAGDEMADVFISYKKERRAHAERLAAVLEAHGYEVWWDYELEVGPDFRDQIEAKLELSKVVVVLWCSGAVRSKFVRSEANRADKRGKLIQAYLEWVVPPLGFEEAQGQPLVNWTGEPDGEVLAGLLAALAERLGERRQLDNILRLLASQPALPPVEPITVMDDEEDDAAAEDSRLVSVLQQQPSAPAPSPSAARWALIEKSLDMRDYEDFLEVFPDAPEAFEARRHRRQLGDWADVDDSSSKAVSAFLKDPTKGANLFEALEAHVRQSMRRAAEAELKAHQEREAAERSKAETEERERAGWEARLGPEAARAALAAKAGKPVAERLFPVRLDGVSGWPTPNMVTIPSGRFLMGAAKGEGNSLDDARPQHEVRIDYLFALGQHTMTFAEWDAALAAGANLEMPGDEGWGRDQRPVINVSWEDAQAYLAWLNGRLGLNGRRDAYRLPSEAEWEYVCRAGTQTPYNFGKKISKSLAHYTKKQTVPVGSFPANAFGLYDMHGNVWELCADNWNENYRGAPVDGSVWDDGDTSRRVLRGGSWKVYPAGLYSARRHSLDNTYRNYDVGFRVARTL
ncbi:MAG: SUMF1/EgtB/PvdO family nonheme iron enzyme [Pseudomonadota bacterium]